MSDHDPYASHMEFLLTVGKNARSVLELGCGKYSTPMFLNRFLFDQVEKVLSLENDPAWALEISQNYGDPRLQIVVMEWPLELYLSDINLDDYDLIFVDNGDMSERVRAICYLADHVIHSKVVIHDFEILDYRVAAKPFKHMILDGFRTPNTAMVWK
jgi:hypothetical protein